MFKEVNKHLLMQLDRLTSIDDEDLATDIDNEVKRAKAICDVAAQAVDIGKTTIEAHKVINEYAIDGNLLGIESNEKKN